MVSLRTEQERRRNELFMRLRTHVEAACDSHSRASLERAFVVLVQLLSKYANRERRKEFVDILKACSDEDLEVYLDKSGALYVNGWIGMKELGERCVWGKSVEIINGQQ
jgi:hypothetical protein